MTDDHSLFYSSSPYDVLMSRRGEKPWKPYPPRRSVSLNKADVVKGQTSDIAKRTSSKAKDNDDLATTVEPGPAIVSVVPVDVSGRSFARLRNQPKKMKAPEEEAPLNGSIARRVSARYSTLLDSSNYDLYGVQEHGFAVKQSLNLRSKTPSKDRWTARTSMNLDPYSFEDDLHLRKTPSRGLIPRLEKLSSKNKPSSSFLLCSSRKSIQPGPREPARPYQMTPRDRSLTSEMSQASAILPSKRQRISSENLTREPVGIPRPVDNSRESDKKKRPRPDSGDLSQGQAQPVSSGPVANHVPEAAYGSERSISDHEPFFVSVAAPSRHSFWTAAAAKTRKSLPVPVPRLNDDDLTVATSTQDPKSRKGTAEAFTVMHLEDAGRVPCSFQVISETGCNGMFGRAPVSAAMVQVLPGRKIEKSNGTSKPRYQSRHLLSPLDLKEQEKAPVSSGLMIRHSLTNLGSQTKQSVPSIPRDRQEAFDNVVRHESIEAKHGGLEKVEEATTQRLSVTSDFASDYNEGNFSFPHPDGASVRSSTISDWYSARDCHTSSICMDSLGSDPVSLDCASSKGSTTLFSRVKRAIVQSFGVVWTMLVPTSTRPHMSPAADSLSDVDSGCSLGTNLDLGALQRSPSEMSEIQKLAVLAEKIAADKSRDESEGQGSNGSSPSRRRLGHAFSSELENILARSASLSGTRCGSHFAEKQMYLPTPGCHPSSADSSRTFADNSWNTSYSSETAYLTLPLSSKRNSRNFEPPHNPLQQTCNYFSKTRPFVSSLKVHDGCGEIQGKTVSRASDCVSVKSPNVAYVRNSTDESNPNESSKKFSTLDRVKLSCPGNPLPYKAPHFEISCHAEKQRATVAGSWPSTSRTTFDIKLPDQTVAGTSLNVSRPGASVTSTQSIKENFAKKREEQCVNNQLNPNLPSSNTQAEHISTNSHVGIESSALFSAAPPLRLISESGTQKSAELSREFSDSGRGACPDEQLSFAPFSVSPELDQAIEMLSASSRKIQSDWSPNRSASCITTSTSKAAGSKANNCNDAYVSPEELRRFLEQSSLSSDVCPKVEANLETQTKKQKHSQCFEGSIHRDSKREISDVGFVLNPKSCSLNDSVIQIVTSQHFGNAHLLQNTSTAENCVDLNKTGAQARNSREPFGTNHIVAKMSPAKRNNSAAVLPMMSPDMENHYGTNRQMFENFHTREGRFSNNTAGTGKMPHTGSCYGAKSREQSREPRATKVAPNIHKADFVLGKASGASAAPNQSAKSSVNNLGRKSGAVAASPSAQRTWASRLAFLTGESS